MKLFFALEMGHLEREAVLEEGFFNKNIHKNEGPIGKGFFEKTTLLFMGKSLDMLKMPNYLPDSYGKEWSLQLWRVVQLEQVVSTQRSNMKEGDLKRSFHGKVRWKVIDVSIERFNFL